MIIVVSAKVTYCVSDGWLVSGSDKVYTFVSTFVHIMVAILPVCLSFYVKKKKIKKKIDPSLRALFDPFGKIP